MSIKDLPLKYKILTCRARIEWSGDLGVALPCSRPMAASEVENSNEPQEAC